MRIVKNLSDINECPNCGSQYHLREVENDLGPSYVVCINCHEELYEGEDTCYDVGKAPDDIDDSLMDIEYEVGNLPRYATNKDELEQLERIRDIFDELISVIRRMK
jgi:hypothetical protein